MCDDVVCDPEEMAYTSSKLIYESATTKSLLTSDSNLSGDKKNRKRSINNNTNCRKIPPHLQNHTYAKQWDKKAIDDGTCHACKMEMMQQQQQEANQSMPARDLSGPSSDEPCTEIPRIHVTQLDMKDLPQLKKIKTDQEVEQSTYLDLPPLQKNQSCSDSETETEDIDDDEDTGQYSGTRQPALLPSSGIVSHSNQIDLNHGESNSHVQQLTTSFPSSTDN